MKKCVAKFLRIAFEISFFHFGCCNLPFLYFSFWFLPVKTLKKYSEYSEHLFEYSNIIRLFKMGRIRIRIVLFGKKYSNIRIIRIFVSTLVQTGSDSTSDLQMWIQIIDHFRTSIIPSIPRPIDRYSDKRNWQFCPDLHFAYNINHSQKQWKIPS